MPCHIKCLTATGLHSVDYTADSLSEAASYEPDYGVYTVANTFNTYQTLSLDAHLDRLEDSARRSQIPLQLDRQLLRGALRALITEADFGDVRFRVTVPGKMPNKLILSIEPFTPPSQDIVQKGVRCITVAHNARSNPAAKTTDWMHQRQAIQGAMPDGTYEAFLLSENGHLLEGLGSNVYAILNGELRTAGQKVLEGIAQQVVFEIAPEILPVRKEAIHINDIPEVSEMFLTSSSRGIIPVIGLDDTLIGKAVVGEQTRILQTRYDAWVQAHLEEL